MYVLVIMYNIFFFFCWKKKEEKIFLKKMGNQSFSVSKWRFFFFSMLWKSTEKRNSYTMNTFRFVVLLQHLTSALQITQTDKQICSCHNTIVVIDLRNLKRFHISDFLCEGGINVDKEPETILSTEWMNEWQVRLSLLGNIAQGK